MNIQQTILNGIREQLFYNNYLVLPGFGGFVLKSAPAGFSGSGNVLMPASKTVSFNSQLKQNDAVMALWLQNKLNCDVKEAMAHLTEFASFCTGILQAKRRLTLDGIGFFYLDFENNVCFEPKHDVNFLTDSFGLGPLLVNKLIITEAQIPKKEMVFEDRVPPVEPLTPHQPQLIKRKYPKLLIPAILLVFTVSLLSLLMLNANIRGQFQSSLSGHASGVSFVPISYPELMLLKNKPEENAYVADANGIAGIEIDEDKTLFVNVLEEKSKAVKTSLAAKSNGTVKVGSGNFEIVLGCFSIRQNATRMVEKLALKQVDAYVSGRNHKGMHVVSLGRFASKEEALSRLLQIKDNFPNAWIKKPE